VVACQGVNLNFMPSQFYFRQLLSGQDFAREDPFAQQMVNFVYLDWGS